MNEWLPKAIVNQDGISLFFFINLLVLLRLHLTTPRGLIGPFKKLILKERVCFEDLQASLQIFY